MQRRNLAFGLVIVAIWAMWPSGTGDTYTAPRSISAGSRPQATTPVQVAAPAPALPAPVITTPIVAPPIAREAAPRTDAPVPVETAPAETATPVVEQPQPQEVPVPTLGDVACSGRMVEPGPGDSWWSLAESAGIRAQELVELNDASMDTAIRLGIDRICMPATPTTTAAPSTAAPSSAPATAAPSTAPSPPKAAAPKSAPTGPAAVGPAAASVTNPPKIGQDPPKRPQEVATTTTTPRRPAPPTTAAPER